MIILSFNIHLEKLQMKAKMRLKNSDHSQKLKIVCDKITRRLCDAKT